MKLMEKALKLAFAGSLVGAAVSLVGSQLIVNDMYATLGQEGTPSLMKQASDVLMGAGAVITVVSAAIFVLLCVFYTAKVIAPLVTPKRKKSN